MESLVGRCRVLALEAPRQQIKLHRFVPRRRRLYVVDRLEIALEQVEQIRTRCHPGTSWPGSARPASALKWRSRPPLRKDAWCADDRCAGGLWSARPCRTARHRVHRPTLRAVSPEHRHRGNPSEGSPSRVRGLLPDSRFRRRAVSRRWTWCAPTRPGTSHPEPRPGRPPSCPASIHGSGHRSRSACRRRASDSPQPANAVRKGRSSAVRASGATIP